MSSGQFFDGFADTFDTFYDQKRNPLMRWVDDRFRRDIAERYRLTFQSLGDLTGKTVLDIGCGSGPYLLTALRQGAQHVTGVDPAPRMLELASQRIASAGMADRLSIVEGYFPGARVDGTFDYAIVMGVLDYVADPAAFLKALRPLLRKGAAISFPSTHWFRTPFRSVRYRLRSVPVYFYTAARIDQLMKEAGIRKYTVTKIAGAGQDFFVWIQA